MSETGVIPGLDEATIVEKGRLGPGQMINVDLQTGEFKNNIEIKREIAARHPYQEWMDKHAKYIPSDNELGGGIDDEAREYDDATTNFLLASFGWSLEDINMQIYDMASR